MLYAAFASFAAGALVFALGLAGVVRGAGAFSNAAMLLSGALLAAAGLSGLRQRYVRR
jgi:hypothetical protein